MNFRSNAYVFVPCTYHFFIYNNDDAQIYMQNIKDKETMVIVHTLWNIVGNERIQCVQLKHDRDIILNFFNDAKYINNEDIIYIIDVIRS